MMSNEEFVIKNTKDIQIKSLCAFMEQLGYVMYPDGKFYSNTYWESYSVSPPMFKGCNVLSLNTAVRLHNHWWDSFNYNFKAVECVAFPEGSIFCADPYTYNKAQAAKIVKQVFLQGTKYGVIKCHKHMVKFTDPTYQYMFLGQVNESDS